MQEKFKHFQLQLFWQYNFLLLSFTHALTPSLHLSYTYEITWKDKTKLA